MHTSSFDVSDEMSKDMLSSEESVDDESFLSDSVDYYRECSGELSEELVSDLKIEGKALPYRFEPVAEVAREK